MIPLILSYPIETASAVGLLLGGLWMRYGLSRIDMWGRVEVWARSNRYACIERARVRNLGVDVPVGDRCLSHILQGERR